MESRRNGYERKRTDAKGIGCESTVFYVIGDYEGGMVFSKAQLQSLASKHKAVENRYGSAKGVLIPIDYLRKHHVILFEF